MKTLSLKPVLLILIFGCIYFYYGCQHTSEVAQPPTVPSLETRLAHDPDFASFMQTSTELFQPVVTNLATLDEKGWQRYQAELDALEQATSSEENTRKMIEQLGFSSKEAFDKMVQKVVHQNEILYRKYPELASMSELERIILYQKVSQAPAIKGVIHKGLRIADRPAGRTTYDAVACSKCYEEEWNCLTRVFAKYTTELVRCMTLPSDTPEQRAVKEKCRVDAIRGMTAEIRHCQEVKHACTYVHCFL